MRFTYSFVTCLLSLVVVSFGCSSSLLSSEPTPTPKNTPLPVFQTRQAAASGGAASTAAAREGGTSLRSDNENDAPEWKIGQKWEHNLDRTYSLNPPIPAGTILKITGPRFSESGLFSVWALDEDKVKDQLLMNTTDSRDVENFRLRDDAYYFEVDTEGGNLWTIEIEKLP